MDIYTATEEAYKNGYNQVLKDSYESIEAAYQNGLKDAVKHGHWIVEFEPNGNPYCLHCSVCDDEFRRIDVDTAYPYCPWCGAKMDNIEGIYHETN